MTYNNPNMENNSKNKNSRCIICAKFIEVDKLQMTHYYYGELDINCKASDLKLYRIFNEILPKV
jgi:hypothetical protein